MMNTAEILHVNEQDREQALNTLIESIAQRAKQHDEDGSFVHDNYEDLKAEKLFSVAIPSELGGGGLKYSELADFICELAQACGSTALAYAMHSHPVMLNVYKYLNMKDEKAKATLSKLAANELVIAGTGANDWLQSNGQAEDVEGGYLVNAHKRFVSGGPGAQVFVTSAVHVTDDGEEVIHFAIPFATQGIEIQSNWDTLGMRGTGSNDVLMKDVFVPESAIAARRPAGKWHPMWDMIIPIAMPLIVSAYLGLAERASQVALNSVNGASAKLSEIGQMQNALNTARLARNAMVANCEDLSFKPALEGSESIFSYKAIATEAIHSTIQLAANLVGGPGFFKGHEIERIMRDVRALHFHPLPEAKQREMSGRVALGMSPF